MLEVFFMPDVFTYLLLSFSAPHDVILKHNIVLGNTRWSEFLE